MEEAKEQTVKSKLYAALILLITSILVIPPTPAQATDGLPNSPMFGYGARLDLGGDSIFPAIDLAEGMGLDWIAVDFNWAVQWQDPSQPINLTLLSQVAQYAGSKNINLLISLINAPAWVITPNGPDPSVTSALVQSLVALDPDHIQAVELFPGINTILGWGNVPNPSAYLLLLQSVRQSLDAQGRSTYIVTTLAPVNPGDTSGDVDDRLYLQYLYDGGASTHLPILGLHFPLTMGDPMTAPSAQNPFVLRHYEEIRSIMLANNHQSGILWISGFSWPTIGEANPNNPLDFPQTPEFQAQWLGQALQLLQAQLYIGAAFIEQLNPSSSGAPYLLTADGSAHPACQQVSELAQEVLTPTQSPVPTPEINYVNQSSQAQVPAERKVAPNLDSKLHSQ